MKKMCIFLSGFFACLALVLIVNSAATLTNTNKTYPKTAQVIELDPMLDTVACIDGAGNKWEFYGVEDWQIGDFVSLLMDDNGTPNTIYDDQITMTLYAGTFGE